MINAGLISLAYPFAILGFALMEETRPNKVFWYVMLCYTELLVFLKFLFQLEAWRALISDD